MLPDNKYRNYVDVGGFKFNSCNAKSLWIQKTHQDTSQIVALQF